MPDSLRRGLVSMSLANLVFLSSWLVLLNPSHYTYYYWPQNPGYVELGALLLDIALLGSIVWMVSTLVLGWRSASFSRIASFCLPLSLVIPLNSFFGDYLHLSLSGGVLSRRWIQVVLILLFFALLMLWFRFWKALSQVVVILLLIFSPLVFVNAASAYWLRTQSASTRETFREKHAPPSNDQPLTTPHIVWIIFDELDQNMAFDSRPQTIKLPEFDRLLKQSLSGRNAYPPNDFTLLSIPALTIGQLLVEATPVRANEVELKLVDGSTKLWGQSDNVFTEARQLGFSTGVSGWFHSYCRVLGAALDSCDWVPVVDQVNPALEKLSLPRAMSLWARMAIYRVPFAFRFLQSRYDRNRAQDHINEYTRVVSNAERVLKRNLNLTLLHYPVPHHPWIFDSKVYGFTSDASSYVDNLVLADKTLGDIRERLEQEGRWDSSIVLLTSDHWWRQSPTVNNRRDHRIPFILKLAGQHTAEEYVTPFNTILTRKLLMELLRGDLSKPMDVVKWIDQNSVPGETPLTQTLP